MRRAFAAWACVLGSAACGAGHGGQPKPSSPVDPAPTAIAAPTERTEKAAVDAQQTPQPTPAAQVPPSPPPPGVDRRFQAYLKAHANLSFPDLERELALSRKPDAPLTFNAESVKYAAAVSEKLVLSPEEKATLRTSGVVNVDHAERYSMGAAYFAVFTRDLPVLITTDSILHALHRSYDDVLKDLETNEFTGTIRDVLARTHAALDLATAALKKPKLRESATDVDLYLTVARNLLDGTEAGPAVHLRSILGNDAKVEAILKKVRGMQLEMPPGCSELRGGRRCIDYSQFRPRGHYTESKELARYFQAVMWLGRADTGFIVAPPDPNSGIGANDPGKSPAGDDERELRAAAFLTLMLKQAGDLDHFNSMGRLIDFLVGSADSLTVGDMMKSLADTKLEDTSQLDTADSIKALQSAVSAGSRQQVRSQVMVAPETAETELRAPALFQLFGQRFLLDSYVLSHVVYDSISFKGKKVERQMPLGLDAMAALGNDEATRLLRPELEKFEYSSNLLAARRTIDGLLPEELEANAYSLWLDALRKLDDVPAKGHFPEVMRRTAYQRKQLQTQLASWAELRHDTVLYGKQSYSVGILCEYPEGYVEPYPEFFARLALLTQDIEQRLGATGTKHTGYAEFFKNFSATMRYLERLARKELEAKPFTAEESGFLKKTIDARGGGCGPPTYDGWYARLYFGGGPEEWKPTVSDVHTDPTAGTVLQEGVGDANFFVAAIDNQSSRATYVGPVYSYYEFTRPASDRMTDEAWKKLIEKRTLPERPAWWKAAFPAPPKERHWGGTRSRPKETDPRALAAEKAYREARETKDPAEQKRLHEKARQLLKAADAIPGPGPSKAK
jgi:hypothetical protein